MNKFLIFVSYDSFEYMNYLTLFHNDSKILELIEQDKYSELIDEIYKDESSFELTIISSNDASEWDFKKDLSDRIIFINSTSPNYDQIINLLNTASNKKYQFEENSNDEEAEIVKLLYSGKCTIKINDIEQYNNTTEEVVNPIEKKEEKKTDIEELKTELAQIIEKKYGRKD